MIRVWCEFLIQLLHRIWRQVSSKYPQQIKANEFWEYQPPQIPLESRLQTSHFGIGVGVYRGEAVVFRRMASPLSHSERWVVHKLRYRNLRYIRREVVKQLLCLAQQLECGIHTCLVLQDSQTSHVIKLEKCPLKNLLSLPPVSLAEGEYDNDAAQEYQEELQKRIQECLVYQEMSYRYGIEEGTVSQHQCDRTKQHIAQP